MQGRKEYLLACLIEECQEVSQRATKALRFGLTEVQPGQDLTNGSRIRGEFLDLLTVADLLRAEGVELFNFASNSDMRHMREKAEKVEKFMEYSKQVGAYRD